MKDIEKFFSPFWLSKQAKPADLTKLAGKLGIDTNQKLADVMQKVTSKSAVEKFRDLYQPRMASIWGVIKGNGGVVKKLAEAGKVTAKMCMYAMFINMVAGDLALAGDPGAQQWTEAYRNFETAIATQEARGYPDANQVEKAKESLLAALSGFQSGGDAVAILRYMLESKFELEISTLR